MKRIVKVEVMIVADDGELTGIFQALAMNAQIIPKPEQLLIQ